MRAHGRAADRTSTGSMSPPERNKTWGSSSQASGATASGCSLTGGETAGSRSTARAARSSARGPRPDASSDTRMPSRNCVAGTGMRSCKTPVCNRAAGGDGPSRCGTATGACSPWPAAGGCGSLMRRRTSPRAPPSGRSPTSAPATSGWPSAGAAFITSSAPAGTRGPRPTTTTSAACRSTRRPNPPSSITASSWIRMGERRGASPVSRPMPRGTFTWSATGGSTREKRARCAMVIGAARTSGGSCGGGSSLRSQT